jgi:hypothetical protein
MECSYPWALGEDKCKGNCVAGKVAPVPGKAGISPGRMTFCSGTNVARVGLPTTTVADQLTPE